MLYRRRQAFLLTEHLPLKSQAALTLTYKKLNHSLGNKSWAALRSVAELKEKREFVIWLSKDDPSVFSCYACARLHRKVILRSTCLHDLQNVFLFPHQNYKHYSRSICFAQIQLAIMGPGFGLPLHGRSLKRLIELSRTSQSWHSHFHPLIATTTAFRLVQNRLLKVHSSIELDMAKAKQEDKYLRSQAATYLWHGSHDQLGELMQKKSCAHQVNYVQRVISTLMQMDKLQRDNPSAFGPVEGSIYRCTYCATELQYLAEPLYDWGVRCRLSLTAWKDLGSGFDSTEQLWRGHQYLHYNG